MNLNKIPEDIQKSRQFCFWKSVPNNDPTKKPTKKPYGFCKKNKKLIPSLKNPDFWLDWESILNIIPHLSTEWGLGLVLNGGPYVVIDLDNCIVNNEDPTFLESVLTLIAMFKGSYLEISPSGKGLHIIFRGEWPYEQNKGVRPLDSNSNLGTIETYSGKDCRFITLTGLAFKLNTVRYQQLPSNFQNEMRFLYCKYFDKYQKTSNLIPTKSQDNFLQTTTKTVHSSCRNKYFQKKILSIKQKIQLSNQIDNYISVCQANPGNHKSISEADWHFCLFVLNFFSEEDIKDPELLKQFLISERPNRDKLNRTDYIHRTACNAILKVTQNNLTDLSKKPTKYSETKTISKKHIIRICNIMHIFHLGQNKTQQNKPQIISKNPNNYLQVTIPQALNSKDYDYYIQILEQSADYIHRNNLKIDNLTNKYLAVEINIRQILDNLHLTSGGQAYQHFINSLRKLSQVTIMQQKKIQIDDKLSEYSGNLISYIYNKSSKYKKLTIYLNLLTVKILLEGKYNYSLFNFQSYRALEDHRLRFIYYYFCLKTIPGGKNVMFTIDELMESLWQASNDRTTIQSRKKLLITLLENFNKNKNKLDDLQISLKSLVNKLQAFL